MLSSLNRQGGGRSCCCVCLFCEHKKAAASCYCRNLCHFLSYLIDVERGSPLTFPRPTYRTVHSPPRSRNNLNSSANEKVDFQTREPHAGELVVFFCLCLGAAANVHRTGCSGVVVHVSSCRPLLPPYCMSKSAEHCMEHAEEARSAPLSGGGTRRLAALPFNPLLPTRGRVPPHESKKNNNILLLENPLLSFILGFCCCFHVSTSHRTEVMLLLRFECFVCLC